MSTGGGRRRLSREARREVIEQAAAAVLAERGYHGASMDAIARRSGVSAPVLYDHFPSKLALHVRLLERHYAELRAVWAVHLEGDAPAEARVARAFDAWFAYVQEHPFAARMLFRDTTGEPEVAALHRAVAERSRALVLPLLAREPGAATLAGATGEEDPLAMELAWEVFRAALQGLALWWADHPEVPRAQVVGTAMTALWVGFDRARGGERWTAPPAPPG